MSRCLQRRTAWIAAFTSVVAVHGAALAASTSAKRASESTARGKAKPAKAGTGAPEAKASSPAESAPRTKPSARGAEEKKPSSAKQSATNAERAAERSKPSAGAKPTEKRPPATKQADPRKRGVAPVAGPTAANSLAKRRNDDDAPAVEPGLKPPGGARPVSVRSVGSRLVIPSRDVAEQALAFHYANLDDAEVLAELDRRGIRWQPASPPLPGVRTPIRLSGPLHGVTIRSTLPERERRTSVFEILDGRLALALDDFCALLARHDVVELVHYTMYRPPGELPADLNKQIRHPAGLAIDVGALRKADGRWLAVGPHWPSDIGAKTCGEGAREHWSRPGREIVSIACEAADLRMFHFILTPHFDAAHADHLHLEIKPDTRWFLVN
jgi:hypothetical protein